MAARTDQCLARISCPPARAPAPTDARPQKRPPRKDLTDIFATQLPLAAYGQGAFDTRRRTDPADTVRGRFFLLLDEGDPVLIGEVIYTVAFLTQAHEYVRTTYLREDAAQLLNRLAQDAPND